MIKYLEDYYDKLKIAFPELELSDIKKICTYGFNELIKVSNRGGDVLLAAHRIPFSAYIGRIFSKDEDYWTYRDIKKHIKYRIQYLFSRTIWDGYYYFGLSEEEYQKYFTEKKSGRQKEKIKFDRIDCYKIIHETLIRKKNKYIFRLKVKEDRGLYFREENYETRNFDLYALRKENSKLKILSD